MISQALNDLSDDPVKLKEILLVIRETEERLTASEVSYDEARKACRDTKKKMDGIREELRRVTKYGPDPQQGLPFQANGESPGDLDPDSAAAVASYNAKKAKVVGAAKKKLKAERPAKVFPF